MVYRKRKDLKLQIENIQADPKKRRKIRSERIEEHNRKRKEKDDLDSEAKIKRHCLQIDHKHSCLSSYQGLVSFTSDYIQYLKETYTERSYLGVPQYICPYCNATFWFHERNITDSRKQKQVMYSNCCKYGEIKIPPFREPPEFLSKLVNDKDHPLSKHFFAKNKTIQ